MSQYGPGYDERFVWVGGAFPAPTTAERQAMGLIVAPYVHACVPFGCSCSGRLARYIPADERTGLAGALAAHETFVPSRPYSKRELRHQAARDRRYARFLASGGTARPVLK